MSTEGGGKRMIDAEAGEKDSGVAELQERHANGGQKGRGRRHRGRTPNQEKTESEWASLTDLR